MGEVAEVPSGHMLTINPCNRGQMCVPRIAKGNLLPEECNTANELIQKKRLIVQAIESAWPKKTNFPEDLIFLLTARIWQHVSSIGNAYVCVKVPVVIDIKLFKMKCKEATPPRMSCSWPGASVGGKPFSPSKRKEWVRQQFHVGGVALHSNGGREGIIKLYVLFLRSCNLALLFPHMKSPWAGKHF